MFSTCFGVRSRVTKSPVASLFGAFRSYVGGCSDVSGVDRYVCFLGPVWGLVKSS